MSVNNQQLSNYKTPWFTWFLTLSSIIIFILINVKSDFKEISIETYEKFGAPAAIDIYQGQIWGVFTNSFIHSHWIQLSLNLIGLWVFGAFIERRIGFIHYMLFGLFTSIITSEWQLALSTDPGIGLSGVVYAFLGYIFIRSFEEPEFKLKYRKYIYPITFIILIICYAINIIHHGIIATEAMVSGFITGTIVAYVIRHLSSVKYYIIFTLLMGVCSITIFYAPWSSEWYLARGLHYHDVKKYDLAKENYQKAIELLPENVLAKENLKIMEVDNLSDRAYHFHALKKYNTARKIYKKILKIDPTNEWAKEGLAELP
jgi:GlpG protein